MHQVIYHRYPGITMAHIRRPRNDTPRADETVATSGNMYEYIIAGFGFLFLALLAHRLIVQRRRPRPETSFQSGQASKPNCHGIWLGGPALKEWEWRDILPLSIERISPPTALEAPPPKKPRRRPWLRPAKPRQNSKCVTTEFLSQPKIREGEDVSVEFRIAVLVAMPSHEDLGSRGYMNVGVAGVACGV